MVMRGGLGNQLFQYAAMRSIADRLGEELELDTRFYPRTSLNSSTGFWIDQLPIRAKIKRYAETGALAAHGVLLRLKRKLLDQKLRPVFDEAEAGYDRRTHDIRPGSIVFGYFQSAEYLAPYDGRLREELDCKHLMSAAEHRTAESIRSSGNVVSVHVRRGDYLTEAGFTIDNYERYLGGAMAHCRSLHEGVTFRVFSDDVPWCRQSQLFADSCEIHDAVPLRHPMIDLHLMSQCSHHIISNSSFSWWAAWLGDHPDKTIIAPAKWFGGIDTRAARIVPERWTVKDA